jgi:hypothetical protein
MRTIAAMFGEGTSQIGRAWLQKGDLRGLGIDDGVEAAYNEWVREHWRRRPLGEGD